MSTNKKPKSIFTSTINDLIRSAVGEKAKQVEDRELDQYVADLLSREAKEKQAKYQTRGVSAYQPNPSPATPPPKPNKRFLMNIVKATDCHNQAVIRQAEQKAKTLQAKRQRDERGSQYDSSLHDNSSRRTKKRRRSIDSDTLDGSDSDSESDNDNDSDSDNQSDSDSSSSNFRGDNGEGTGDELRMRFRGRGKIRNGSSMDKYFNEEYDPSKDIDSDQEREKKTKKKKKTKKNKKNKKEKKTKKSQHDLLHSKKNKNKKRKQ